MSEKKKIQIDEGIFIDPPLFSIGDAFWYRDGEGNKKYGFVIGVFACGGAEKYVYRLSDDPEGVYSELFLSGIRAIEED